MESRKAHASSTKLICFSQSDTRVFNLSDTFERMLVKFVSIASMIASLSACGSLMCELCKFKSSSMLASFSLTRFSIQTEMGTNIRGSAH